jgi:hypothetical protein
MFANIKIFFNALKSGEQLADAVRAKQWALALTYAQVSIMAVVGVLRAFNITFGGISDEQINILLGGMVTIGTALIGMLGVASTNKIGMGGGTLPAAPLDGADGRIAELSSVAGSGISSIPQAATSSASGTVEPNPKTPLPNQPRPKNPNPADDSNSGGA